MTLSVNSIGFILGVFLIALLCWYLRTRIESNPEPFFLSLTFFAFAGQFIKFAESTALVIARERVFPGYGKMVILVACGVGTVVAQAYVLKVHMQITTAHYTGLLDQYAKPGHKDHVDRWANVLLRITDVDFFPGGYGWLKQFFPTKTEPKLRSRNLAVLALPSKEFRVSSDGTGDGITAKLLEVPPTSQRRFYWWSYVALCGLAWLWFLLAMMLSPQNH